MTPLVLASASAYKRALVERLGCAVVVDPASIDETPHDSESVPALVRRLSVAKAEVVARRRPGQVIIGGDQAASLDGFAVGKPGTPDAARRQLRAQSGRTIEFVTGVCVVAPGQPPQYAVDVTRVRFSALTDARIDDYLAREPALDCAGSFKSEGLGITLVDAIETRDPTALIGMPLIALSGLLRQLGVG